MRSRKSVHDHLLVGMPPHMVETTLCLNWLYSAADPSCGLLQVDHGARPGTPVLLPLVDLGYMWYLPAIIVNIRIGRSSIISARARLVARDMGHLFEGYPQNIHGETFNVLWGARSGLMRLSWHKAGIEGLASKWCYWEAAQPQYLRSRLSSKVTSIQNCQRCQR